MEMAKQTNPEMCDVSNRDLHGIPSGAPSEPKQQDAGNTAKEAPRDAVDEMYDKVKADLETWRAGLARNFPVN
jgi:hypothetical protein